MQIITEEIRYLLSKRAKLIEDQRGILDKCEREKRKLNTEEESRYANMDTEIDNLSKRIEFLSKNPDGIPSLDEDTNARALLFGNEPFTLGHTSRHDFRDLSIYSEKRDARYSTPELRGAFKRYLREGAQAISHNEFRALQADSDTAGGYLVLPLALTGRVIQAVDNEVFMRKLATIFTVPKSESLGAPTLDNDPGDPTWTAEIGTVQEDTTMSLGKRELTPSAIARLIKVSNKLLRLSTIDAEGLVIQRLTYKFGTIMEYNYLLGTGAGQPMGVFTAATAGFGISTARDVSTGNTATAITADGLIEAFFSLKPQYRKKANWIFSREAVKRIRKIKDGEGQYIWQSGFATGKPDTILGAPYAESEYCPNTFTTGLYVGIVGDFSHYWIADGLSMQIQRLVELYAANNQVGFIGRMESDGMPVLEEAFARVTLA